MTTRSKELALDDREFELHLEGADRIDDPNRSLQAKFAVLVCGRLGFRAADVRRDLTRVALVDMVAVF